MFEEQKHSGGFTLLFAVLVTVIVLSIGLIAGNLVIKEIVLSQSVRDSQKAFSAADSAIECALYWDQVHPGLGGYSAFGDTAGATEPDITSGLQLHYKLNETSGTGVADAADGFSSSVRNTGDNLGGVPLWQAGIIDGALGFDGVNDYIQEPTQPAIALTTYTYSAWVKPLSTQGGVVFTHNQGAFQRSPSIILQSSSLQVQVTHQELDDPNDPNLNGGGCVAFSSSQTLTAGQWYHLAITSSGDGGIIKLYINGEFEAQQDHNCVLGIPNTSFRVGANRNGGSPLDGVVDSVRIYNRVLSDSEIGELADRGGFRPPVSQNSNLLCEGADISDPSTGWDTSSGWDVVAGTDAATTTFDVAYDDDTCATVVVEKTVDKGRFSARGYNTCDLNNPRRVERGLRAIY